MLLIGITGGIGSGKSHISGFIKALDFAVYNSDVRAKHLVHRQDVKERIQLLFGEKAYIKNNYNSKYVASLVFNNEELLNELNQIIHPEVQKDFHTFVTVKKEKGAAIIFKESALLIETGAFRNLDKLLLVTAPKEVRKARVLRRKEMTEAKFEAIVSNQADDKRKSQFADFVLSNDEKYPFLPELYKFLNELNTN